MGNPKIWQTVLILLLAVAAVSGTVDTASEDYAEESLKRALITFTAARALNGAISVAQGTELALEPGGIGVIMTPGQILDPVNDLVERFSSVMLFAASSLGLQLVLLEITSVWMVTVAMLVFLSLWLVSVWWPGASQNRFFMLARKAALAIAFVRLAIPVVIICTNLVFDSFLLDKHEMATAELSRSANTIEGINQENGQRDPTQSSSPQSQNDPTSESSYEERTAWDEFVADFPAMDEIGSMIRSSADEIQSDVAGWFESMSVSEKLELLESNAEAATRHIVDLIVIFVLQTILFPLAFLWLFVELLKAVATRSMARLAKPKE